MQRPPRHLNQDLLFLLGLIACIGLLYLPALNEVVIFDDAQIIRNGSLRADLLNAAPRFFTHVSYVVVDQLFGGSIIAQKLCNLLLHGLATALIYNLTLAFLALARNTEPISNTGYSREVMTARIGVALFALSPSAVYATAYLVQRSIVLATIFTLLMMRSFLSGLQTRNHFHLVVSLLFYALALLCKELAVMAIFLLPLIYIVVRSPSFKAVGTVAVCTLAIAAAVASAYLSHYSIALLTPYEPSATQYLAQAGLSGPQNAGLVFALHLTNQLNFFFVYGLNWIVPHPHWMSIDLQPVFPTAQSLQYYLPMCLVFLLLLAFGVRSLFQKSSRTRVIGLLVLLPIVLFQTEFWIVRVQEPFAIYRSYLWAISIPGLVAIALGGTDRRLLVAAGLSLVFWQTGVAVNRVNTFTSDLVIWSDAIEKSRTNSYLAGFGVWRHYINRGVAYLHRGDVRNALDDFRKAENFGALHGVGQYNIAVVLQRLGMHEEALVAFRTAESRIKQDPLLQYRMGETYFALHRLDEAMKAFQRAKELGRDHEILFLASLRVAEVQLLQGRFDEASRLFADLSRIEPRNQRVEEGMGMANVGLGNMDLAQAAFDHSLATSPSANAYYGLALIHASKADFAGALQRMERALSLDPDNATFTEFRTSLLQTAR